MALYISRDFYLSPSFEEDLNAGLIGYHSLIPYGGISVDFDSEGAELVPQLWSSDTYTKYTSPNVVSATSTTIYINVTPAVTGPINYIGIAGHNFGINSQGILVSYKAQYSDDGVTWVDVIELKSQIDNRAIIMAFDNFTKPFWRVVLVVPIWEEALNPFNLIVAHIRAGVRLRLQRREFVGLVPFTMDKVVGVVSDIGDTGQLLQDRVTSEICRYAINQPNNEGDFVRGYILPFLAHCRLTGNIGYGPKGAFFGSWRPDDRPDETLYCFAPSSISNPRNQIANGMMEWSISGSALG